MSNNANPSAGTPFLGFVQDAGDLELLKAFAEEHGWHSASSVFQGNIGSAIEFLGQHPTPDVLLVEIPNERPAAEAALNQLADVCAPDVKVIAVGSVNEYSFFVWLTEMGVAFYVLRPFTKDQLAHAYGVATAAASHGSKEKPPGKLIALTGTRGGVGTSTMTINLAALIAQETKKNVALIDLEPQDGSIALLLDLEPSHGLRESLERPDRLDALFIERVMTRINDTLPLHVMSAEEPLHERIQYTQGAATNLLKLLREKYEVVVIDVARQLRPFAVETLKQVDDIFMVTEFSLMGVRDTLRLLQLYREHWGVPTPHLIINKQGMHPRYQVSQPDFEKGIGTEVDYIIPYAPDIFMAIGKEIPVLKQSNIPAVKEMMRLIYDLFPESKPVEDPKAKGKKK